MFKESIFLVGLMGAGKSTVGRFLADRLHYQFVDSDHVIEQKTGASIPMIFDIEGESGFRLREEQVIDEWTQKPEVVLATGGGAIMSPENRKHLRSRGVVVYLKSSVEALVQRTRHDRNRPLLQNDDPERVLRKLIAEREPFYEEVADLIIQTQQASIHRVVRQILDEVEALNQV